MTATKSMFIILGFCIVTIIFVAGCTQQTPRGTTPTTTITAMMTVAPSSAGIANPASVNCGKMGGTTEIKKNADGSEYGMCTFQNGTSCEEWALFRNEGCKAK